MWCSFCEQDVPGIASQVESEEFVCCARCGEVLGGNSEIGEPSDEPQGQESISIDQYTSDMPTWDDWELDEKLHDVDRLLGELGGSGVNRYASRDTAHWPPNRGDEANRPSHLASSTNPPTSKQPSRRKRSSWLAWSILSLGLMTFVCGSVLLGWSFFAEKAMLWRVGLPLSLIGQAGLLIGLILQLEGLWQNDHEATETLDELDEQIRELRQAAAMLNASHSHAGQSFYLHMAEGASPHLMLADLKSQLDLLAVQMEKQRR